MTVIVIVDREGRYTLLLLFLFLLDFLSPQLLMTFTAFFLGVSIYGPVSLYGVAAIESVPKSVSGASHTFVALAANSKSADVFKSLKFCTSNAEEGREGKRKMLQTMFLLLNRGTLQLVQFWLAIPSARSPPTSVGPPPSTSSS